MATNTYVALDKTTANGSVAQVTLSSISQAYTDLVVVVNGSLSYGSPDRTTLAMRVGNGTLNTSSIYSNTGVYGNGSSASSSRGTSQTYFFTGVMSEKNGTTIVNLQNYSNTTTYKTFLSRGNSLGSTASQDVGATVGLWQSTSAINTVQFYSNDGTNFTSGTTFSLYGIAAEVGGSTPKATGGTITSDSTYYYHTFTTVGNFVPNQNLTADILSIAGGGGGGAGGAGGLLGLTSQSLTANTSYSAIVGAGGAGSNGGNNATNGSNTQFGALTAAVGGGKGGYGSAGTSGGSGGGGGSSGAGTSFAGGSPTSGQGNAGGNNFAGGYPNEAGGGGGGAGAAGSNGTSGAGGAGGIGSSSYSSWGLVTGTGDNRSGTVYYAGGGGAWGRNSQAAGGYGGGGTGTSGNNPPSTINGSANTGGGAGGTDGNPNGNGGSGIIIVRYAK